LNNQVIEQAKYTLRKHAFADFKEQGPALRRILQNLPVLSVPSEDVSADMIQLAQRGNLEETLARLESKWIVYNPPNTHEGAIYIDISDSSEWFTIIFRAEIWEMTSEQARFSVVRIGEDEYLCWFSRR
jgi:hypothetical protein